MRSEVITNQIPRTHFFGKLSAALVFASILVAMESRDLHADDARPAEIEFFEKNVRPILAEHCYECHSAKAKKLKAELLLDRRAGLLKGGESGPSIVPGRPDESLLVEAVRYESYEMPPRGKLPQQKIDVLVEWVRRGAFWPDEPEPEDVSANKPEEFNLHQRKQSHWAWQPVQDPELPSVKDTKWPQADLDAFILSELEKDELSPAMRADRRTLIRRLYFDLIGLPPTSEQVGKFLADESPRALEKVVDELLESPHFGERWGRHWLDLVRYAESRGHEFDNDAPNAFEYRDYVIRALNADVPYDQFVREHIAGDLLQMPRLHPGEGFNESILGTGFWFLGEWVHSPVDIRKDETDRFDNMIDVMSKTFLGLTVACARCHDHKFDAISSLDYYSLSGFLQSSDYRQVRFESVEHNRRIAESLDELDQHMQSTIRQSVVDAVVPKIKQTAAFLSASTEVLHKSASIEAIAKRFRVPEKRLKQWVNRLEGLDKESQAKVMGWLRSSQNSTGRRKARSVNKQSSDNSSTGDESHGDAAGRIVVDYAVAPQSDFMQDGFSFGLRPVRAGQLVTNDTPTGPALSIIQYDAARRDPIWNSLQIDERTVTNEKNSLSKFPRAGRTLRTPTFELQSGTLSYLIAGGCHIVVCVDSHRLVSGPLHSETLLEVKPDENLAPRWVSQKLNRYIGHRLHVEFTTREEDPLEILKVVDGLVSDGPQVSEPPGQTFLRLARESSPQERQDEIEESLSKALEAWQTGALHRDPNATPFTQIIQFLVDNLDLLARPNSSLRRKLDRQIQEYTQQRAELCRRIEATSRTAMAMWDGTGENDHVLIRGSHANPGQLAPRRFLEAIAGDQTLGTEPGSGRLELARQINDPQNPFTSRVIVNRIWHHLFGRGIVPTVDDFGVLGQPPTHPELLDHLAVWFLNHGRSLKQTIKYIVLSESYQMSSHPGEREMRDDPKNLLWHHMPVKRLEGEVIRDSLLEISGRLDGTMYGESVPIHLTTFMDGRGRPRKSGPQDGDGRRSIYVAVRRNFLSPFMLTFDTPVPFSTMGRRNVSNVPAQSLILLNDPLVVELSQQWASRALNAEPSDRASRIQWMYETAFARPPRAEELQAALQFVDDQARERKTSADDPMIWSDLAHTLINVKEFIFIR